MTVKFSLSPLFFWIKGSISVDQKFVKVHSKNTILGAIPVGDNAQSIPVNNISATNMTTSFVPLQIASGFVYLLLCIYCCVGCLTVGDVSIIARFLIFILGVIFLIAGISSFARTLLICLSIQRAGSDYCISVPFYEKKKMLMAKDAIDELLAGHLDNINVRAASKDIIKAMKEK